MRGEEGVTAGAAPPKRGLVLRHKKGTRREEAGRAKHRGAPGLAAAISRGVFIAVCDNVRAVICVENLRGQRRQKDVAAEVHDLQRASGDGHGANEKAGRRVTHKCSGPCPPHVAGRGASILAKPQSDSLVWRHCECGGVRHGNAIGDVFVGNVQKDQVRAKGSGRERLDE